MYIYIYKHIYLCIHIEFSGRACIYWYEFIICTSISPSPFQPHLFFLSQKTCVMSDGDIKAKRPTMNLESKIDLTMTYQATSDPWQLVGGFYLKQAVGKKT